MNHRSPRISGAHPRFFREYKYRVYSVFPWSFLGKHWHFKSSTNAWRKKTSKRIETYLRLEMFCTLELAAIERQQARQGQMLVGPCTVLALVQYVGIGDYLRNCPGNTEPDNAWLRRASPSCAVFTKGGEVSRTWVRDSSRFVKKANAPKQLVMGPKSKYNCPPRRP